MAPPVPMEQRLNKALTLPPAPGGKKAPNLPTYPFTRTLSEKTEIVREFQPHPRVTSNHLKVFVGSLDFHAHPAIRRCPSHSFLRWP